MQEITMKAVIESIPAVTDFVDAQLEAIDCPMKAQMQINVAIDEIFSNISHYAYPGSEGEATVRFEYDPQAKEAKVCFRDHGVPYNSLNKSDPDVTLPASQRKIGGLGIFMVKKSMDSMTYEYRDGQNRLSFRKKLD